MRIMGEQVICSKCGSKDMRRVAGVLAECNKCGVGHLTKEFSQWKDDWKLLPPKGITRRIKDWLMEKAQAG